MANLGISLELDQKTVRTWKKFVAEGSISDKVGRERNNGDLDQALIRSL
jgi:hypothetical protein